MTSRIIGERGQVVIPKPIRELLGIRPGERIIFENDGENIIIKPDSSNTKMLELIKKTPKLNKHLTIKDIKKTLEEQYDIP